MALALRSVRPKTCVSLPILVAAYLFFEVVNRTAPETQEPMPFSGFEVPYRARDIDARFGEMVELRVVFGRCELFRSQGPYRGNVLS